MDVLLIFESGGGVFQCLGFLKELSSGHTSSFAERSPHVFLAVGAFHFASRFAEFAEKEADEAAALGK